MTNTALTIRTDSQTKKMIADFAKSLGLSTSAFITAVTLQAVREQRVVLTLPTLEPTAYLKKTMRESQADRKAGRNYTTVNNKVELDDFFKTI